MTILLYTLIGLLLFMALILVLLVLIQKGRGGGLASAFGGAGGNTAFGSKTGDVLTWATSVVFGIFLVLAVVTNLTANSIHAARQKTLPAAKASPIQAPATPLNGESLNGSPQISIPSAGTPANAAVPVPPEQPAGDAAKQQQQPLTAPPASQPSH